MGWWTFRDLVKSDAGRMVRIGGLPMDRQVIYLRSNGYYYTRSSIFLQAPVDVRTGYLNYGDPEPIGDLGELVFRFNVQLLEE
jgi:hypothetical protein